MSANDDDSSSKHEWSFKQTLELIEDYKGHANLWFTNHPNYRNRDKRLQSLAELSTKYGVSKHEIERKLKNLSCQYFREKKRMTGGSASKKVNPEHYISNWFAFNSLDFLFNKRAGKDEDDDENQDDLIGPTRQTEYEVPIVTNESTISSKRTSRDEYSVFGELVALKLKKIPNAVARYTVQYKIQTLLWEATLGQHVQPPATTNTAKAKPSTSAPKRTPKRSPVKKSITPRQLPNLTSILANQPVVFITPIDNPLPLPSPNIIKTENTSPKVSPPPSPTPQNNLSIENDISLDMDIDNEFFINEIKREENNV